jgi:hypothetical protein
MTVDRSRDSHAYENLIEHLFLADLLRHMWFDRKEIVEVAKAQVDSWGYDVVLTASGRTRFVQLKTSVPVDVHTRLASRAGGCVVVVRQERNGQQLRYRLWEPESDNADFPHSKRKVYRRNSVDRDARVDHRQAPASRFGGPVGITALCEALFPSGA